jgi:acetylornithine deacetylase/succinyl-diaminopimelate desuccinylase-like protein
VGLASNLSFARALYSARVNTSDAATAGEVTELLQALIRNACVNDGSIASGVEARSVETLTSYFDDRLDLHRVEPAPGRASLIARIEGRRRDAPTLLLMGHTDVVPVNVDGWTHDPFGGELIEGDVWGRGAIDMLNLTASMAVATKHLAESGFAPDGTLIYLAVADEEALGTWGADHVTQHERDAVAADYVVTESGGIPVPTPAGPRLPVSVAEKGSCWCTLRVHGTPGHASAPYRTDNALITAAEVVRRIAEARPETRVDETWKRTIDSFGFPADLAASLTDPGQVMSAAELLPEGLARIVHACTHTTVAPTVIRGGTKTNVIPDRVDIEVDIRTLDGVRGDDVRALIDEALGDLAHRVEIVSMNDDPATSSPMDTPLWDALGRVTKAFYADSELMPLVSFGATDARFFRRIGTTAYGFGLFSTKMGFEQYGAMFHGDDERVDVESLRLSTDMWAALARDMLTS